MAIHERAQIYLDTQTDNYYPDGRFIGHKYIAWIGKMSREYKKAIGIGKEEPIPDQDAFTSFIRGWHEQDYERIRNGR